MKKNFKHWPVLVLLLIILACSGADCEGQPQQSGTGATQVIDFVRIPLNSRGNTVEQQNIQDRINATMSPTKVMWIHLIALDGEIIRRMPVRSKVTSSGKRLEPTQAANANGGYYPNAGIGNFETDEFLQADGTYGSSDPYIYWFDPTGRYHQWGTAGGLGYLKTDYPIDLADPIDEITGLYNMSRAAYEWQKLEEDKLIEREAQLRVSSN